MDSTQVLWCETDHLFLSVSQVIDILKGKWFIWIFIRFMNGPDAPGSGEK